MNKLITHLAIENIFRPIAKKGMEFLFHILTMTVLSLEIYSHFSHEPIIKLEVEKSDSTYSLVGMDLDQDYSLEYVKIYPLFDSSVEPVEAEATFQYDHYKDEVKLKESEIEKPKAYVISRELLQDKLKDENFLFRFLYDERFKFYFKFKEGIENEPQFECQIVALKDNFFKEDIPCEVVEKDSSFFAKVNIYGMFLVLLGVFWYMLAAMFFRNILKAKRKDWGDTHDHGDRW
ncbi:MAG: hypothetical protein VSS75_004815 [Candidatus Parabeggiatoa sp.]|nr:hypothetical protein [Candidatus Parabeggiatoa sp.]